MCMKLVNQQQQNIQNINSISEENEIQREQLNRRNATIAENETDILNKQLELSNLKSTQKKREQSIKGKHQRETAVHCIFKQRKRCEKS